MTPDEVKRDYRAAMDRVGEVVTIRRYTGSGPNRPRFDADVRARVTDYEPHELVGTIVQGDRKVVVLADDLVSAQVQLDLRKGDKAVIRGKEFNIESVDDNTRRVAGVLVAYDLQVRG